MRGRTAGLLVCALTALSLSCATSASAPPGPATPSPVIVPAAPLLAPDTSFEVAADSATMVFEAYVLQRNASTVSFLPSQPFQTIVTVGQVFRTADGMDDIGGDTITVVVRDTTGLAVGAHAVFFAYGILLGKNIAVGELKRVPVTTPASVDSVRTHLAVADSVNINRAMAARALASDALVLGSVDSTVAIAISDSAARRRSEHAPSWKRAFVHVTSAFLLRDSALVGQRVPVVFVTKGGDVSDDPPKLDANQRYMLWVHRLSRLPVELRSGIDTTSQYYVLEADDVRPATDSARVALSLRPTVLLTPLRRPSPRSR
jgi:hypothetical protein